MKAIWNNQVIAQSDQTVIVEGNHYFPADSLDQQFFVISDTRSTCPYKGVASYYSIRVDGSLNADAAWFYPEVKDLYGEIKGRVAFWRGVEVVEG